jgi:hypothetical protein
MTKGIILFPPKFPIGASELLGPNESLRCFAIQCFANLGINIEFLKPCYLSFCVRHAYFLPLLPHILGYENFHSPFHI